MTTPSVGPAPDQRTGYAHSSTSWHGLPPCSRCKSDNVYMHANAPAIICRDCGNCQFTDEEPAPGNGAPNGSNGAYAGPEQPQAEKPLEPDAAQIEQFIRVVFKHATPNTFVSLRSFYDGVKNKTFNISAVRAGRWTSSSSRRPSEHARALKQLRASALLPSLAERSERARRPRKQTWPTGCLCRPSATLTRVKR
jgi:hypothetical protein